MAYESPLELFVQDLGWKIEGEIMTAVRKVGVKVDKDELVKAIAYERDQYQKGYEDGRSDAVRHGRWEWLGPNSMVSGCMCGTCSVCKVRSKYIVNVGICPNCGAKMDGGLTHD